MYAKHIKSPLTNIKFRFLCEQKHIRIYIFSLYDVKSFDCFFLLPFHLLIDIGTQNEKYNAISMS